MAHRLFGIRHHGPGCARNLVQALVEYAPDCILIEGPPDAEHALPLVADPDLRPPVALLVHSVDDPRRAVFYPFALFSPEWQALRYAAERRIASRFMDLPCAHRLPGEHAARARPSEAVDEDESSAAEDDENEPTLRDDPIGMLAEAAGFVDREQWWDSQVEQRTQGTGLFEAIQEAMTTLRGDAVPHALEAEREAHMRSCLRKAEKDGFERIAVVCGAWHVPALCDLSNAKADAELLKGLPKEKVACTWIPWTHSRLSYKSGYGAGVDSPGWYEHVWQYQGRAPLTWCVRAARLLRGGDLEASSASVIESVRLAEALAVLRDLPSPGLSELRESILSVLCGGDRMRLELIREKLEVGELLGNVPENAARVPVQLDFEREVKRLRLKVTTEQVTLKLDLRKENDVDRSRLIHRLSILGLAWGEPLAGGRSLGTFKESFRLAWDPEFAVELVAANLYGNTVASAARGRLRERATKAGLSELARMIEVARLADLPEVYGDLLLALGGEAAKTSDVRLLFDAAAPLARVVRYGDVRGSSSDEMLPVFKGLIERALVGLLPSSTQLDDDAAESLLASLDRGRGACQLLHEAALADDFLNALGALSTFEPAHPRLRGRATRWLLEQQRIQESEFARITSLSLSSAVDPGVAARWLEGLVAGEGMFLVHQESVLGTLDRWLAGLTAEVFQAQLPLLRRAFCDFRPAERRTLAQKLKSKGAPALELAPAQVDFDLERAALVVPVLATVLGVEP